MGHPNIVESVFSYFGSLWSWIDMQGEPGNSSSYPLHFFSFIFLARGDKDLWEAPV